MPTWQVQLHGSLDIYQNYQDSYELSVIRSDNKHGKLSWGWGGVNKIILFSSGVGGNAIFPLDQDNVLFALDVADKLCDILNTQN